MERLRRVRDSSFEANAIERVHSDEGSHYIKRQQREREKERERGMSEFLEKDDAREIP